MVNTTPEYGRNGHTSLLESRRETKAVRKVQPSLQN